MPRRGIMTIGTSAPTAIRTAAPGRCWAAAATTRQPATVTQPIRGSAATSTAASSAAAAGATDGRASTLSVSHQVSAAVATAPRARAGHPGTSVAGRHPHLLVHAGRAFGAV